MPSDAARHTGRSYCGAVHVRADGPPILTAYCHCENCRRVSGAPVAAFAPFHPDAVRFTPPLGDSVCVTEGVDRWFCRSCGSSLAATCAYLPDQIYLPVGLFDDASDLAPKLHAHAHSQIEWLCLSDTLPRIAGSGRGALNATADD